MVLKTDCLTKKYGQQRAVDKVSLNIEKGDIYGLIGKNGAGKTTIMKIACGLIHQNEGSIQLFESSDLEKGRKRIGCVIEQPALYPGMTARENLIYYSKLRGCPDMSRINDSLELVGLKDTGKKKAKNFSLGMKQRLSIAISLLGNPDFLILDEPINGLDPSGIKEIRELLLSLNQERGITILISSHILGELSKIATKYGVIDSGVLVDEFTSHELEERCKKCLSLVVDDTKKASYVLTNTVKSKDFQVFDHGKICVYDFMDNPAQINKALVESGISVSTVCFEGNDTEAYFVKMMGGTK
jgi:ABC-2 type transport system ATP-binding protein